MLMGETNDMGNSDRFDQAYYAMFLVAYSKIDAFFSSFRRKWNARFIVSCIAYMYIEAYLNYFYLSYAGN